MMRKLIALTLTLIFTSGDVSGAQGQSGVPVKGRYSNYDYAYSVLIPRGMVAFRNQAPFPNHGFGIDVSKSEQAYLWVDASYNGLEWKSFDEAVNANVDLIKDNTVTNIKLAKQSPTYLSKLRAVRFIVLYDVSGKPMVQETVLAFRREKNKEEIVYSINLRTPVNRYKQDRMLIAKLQRTWELTTQP